MKKFLYILGLMVADIAIIAISLLIAILLKNEWVFTDYGGLFFFVFVLSAGVTIASNSVMNCYGNVLKNAGALEMGQLSVSLSISMVITIILIFVQHSLLSYVQIDLYPLIPIVIIAVLIEFLLMSALRFSYRIKQSIVSRVKNFKNLNTKTILIYGKIENYAHLIDRIYKDYSGACKIVAILSNDRSTTGMKTGGIDIVFGGVDELETVLDRYNIDEVVAGSAVEGNELKAVYRICKENKCELKMYSDLVYLTEENFIKNSSLQDVKIEDLLGRREIKLNTTDVRNFLKGKVVFVSGGAGSIGSEICRQVLDMGCKLLIAFDINENGLFELDNELKKVYDSSRFIMKIGSIRDTKRFDYIFSKYSPNIVFHAAAHKHVPMMEGNPGEAIKNNIFGTYNVASKAVEYNVEKFILISTDKAVNPTNIMGASKRVAELEVRALNKMGETKLAAVRFGNVLGSNGSVIPIFKKQIAAGGPVTVTHPEIERYFMTIPEAVSLVLQAGLMAKGGEVFELDMGKSMKIYDLACEMIRLSGLEPEVDIKIEFTGLRPGEKLFEELNLDTENLMKTESEKIFLCNFAEDNTDYLEKIEHLKEIVDSDNPNTIAQNIKNIVKEYTSVTFEITEEHKAKTEINKISINEEPV